MAVTSQQYRSSCVCYLWIFVSVQVAFGQSAIDDFKATRFLENSQPNRFDELGDPLPRQARFQFGTERFVSRQPVFDMALTPDGKTVLTRDSENIHCWDAVTGKIRWIADVESQWGASYGLRAFAFTSSSEFFFSQSGPETLLKFNVATGKPTFLQVKNGLPLLPENRPVNSFPGSTAAIDVNQNGSRIAAAGGHGVIVYDSAGNSLIEIPNKPNLALAPADWKRDPMLFGGHYSTGIFSPDEKTLAVVTSDAPQRVRVHDATSGAEIRVIELGSRLVRMAFAPDGSSIATTERNCTVSQYSIATGEPEWEYLREPAEIFEFSSAISYSPNGRLIAAALPQLGQELICIFDAKTGVVQSVLTGHTLKPWALAFTSDSTTLFSAGLDRIIRRWDVLKSTERPLEKGFHGSGIAASTPNRTRMAFSDSLGNIHLKDTSKVAHGTIDEQIIKTDRAAVSAFAFSHDQKLLACGSSVTDELIVTVWDTSTREVVHRWQWRERGKQVTKIGTLEFSPDGHRLAAAANGRGRAYLLDIMDGKQVAELLHESICGLSFDRNGNQLVTAGANGKLCFWNSATGNLLSTKEMIGGDLQNVRCSPVDDLIVTAHFPNVLRMWNAKDMTLRKRAPLTGEANFEALAFSPDGNWLVTGSSGIINIVNPRTAERVWRVGSHSGRLLTVGFAEQGKVLVSGGSDGMVYCWELMPENATGAPDYDKLWLALRGGHWAKWANWEADPENLLWQLVQIGDPAVEEVERRLMPITRVVNLQAIAKGVDLETANSRIRLALQLCDRNPEVELDSRLKLVIQFLAMLRNQKSIALLKQLATTHPCNEVRREAMTGLETIQ